MKHSFKEVRCEQGACYKFDNTCFLLPNGRNCPISVAQWSGQQYPTAVTPVRAPGGSNTRPAIFMIL